MSVAVPISDLLPLLPYVGWALWATVEGLLAIGITLGAKEAIKGTLMEGDTPFLGMGVITFSILLVFGLTLSGLIVWT